MSLNPSFSSNHQQSTTIIVPPLCPHLTQFKSTNGTTPFHNFLQRVTVKPLGRATARKGDTKVMTCGACGHAHARMYVCVTCNAVMCVAHAPDHDHEIVVDVDRAELFCCMCCAQVYDRDFDTAIVTLGACSHAPQLRESLRKRRRVEYRPWTPDSKEKALLGAGYGITDTWEEIVDTLMEIAPTTLERVNKRVTELDTTIRQRTDEFEVHFEEAQDDRALLRARVNTLFRVRLDHRRTTMLMDREAMYAREIWAFSMNRSSTITAHVRTLKTQVAALIVQTSSLQTQLTTALGRIEILEARDLEPQERRAPGETS
nr:ubiquitin carboxyl-terminal hydrolase 22-like [Tanacetum cinerariifolium]